MNNSNVTFGKVVAGLLIVAIMAVVGWFTPYIPMSKSGATGSLAVEDYNPVVKYNGGYFSALPIETTSTFTAAGLLTVGTGGIKFGASGSTVTQALKGTCSLIYSAALYSFTASTTKAIDCAVTGVIATDLVFVMASSSTVSANYQGWVITGAVASSTDGFISMLITNNSGATAGIPRSIASSTPYLIIR